MFPSDYKDHAIGHDVIVALWVILVPTYPDQNPFPHNTYLALPQPSAALDPKLGMGFTRHIVKPIKAVFSATTTMIL